MKWLIIVIIGLAIISAVFFIVYSLNANTDFGKELPPKVLEQLHSIYGKDIPKEAIESAIRINEIHEKIDSGEWTYKNNFDEIYPEYKISKCPDHPAGSWFCYSFNAKLKEDPSICEYIEDMDQKNVCYIGVAGYLRKTSICDLITEQKRKEQCLTTVNKNLTLQVSK